MLPKPSGLRFSYSRMQALDRWMRRIMFLVFGVGGVFYVCGTKEFRQRYEEVKRKRYPNGKFTATSTPADK